MCGRAIESPTEVQARVIVGWGKSPAEKVDAVVKPEHIVVILDIILRQKCIHLRPHELCVSRLIQAEASGLNLHGLVVIHDVNLTPADAGRHGVWILADVCNRLVLQRPMSIHLSPARNGTVVQRKVGISRSSPRADLRSNLGHWLCVPECMSSVFGLLIFWNTHRMRQGGHLRGA